MESPPNYMAPPKNKSNAVIWWIVGGIFGCCLIGALAIGGGGFWLFNKAKGMGTCMIAFQNVNKAVHKYATDHSGLLPKAETWQDDVREDYRSFMIPKEKLGPIEQMQAEGDWGCKDDKGQLSGISFNSDLSGKKLSSIGDQVSTVMIFETDHASMNQHAPYKRQDPAASPTILGQHRGWTYVTVGGMLMMDDPNRGPHPANSMNANGFNIETKSDSSEGDDGKPVTPPPAPKAK